MTIDIWKIFASQMSGSYIKREYWHSDKAIIPYKDWKIIFDNYIEYRTVSSTTIEKKYTRVVAPFLSGKDFTFKIYNKGPLDAIAILFGAQNIKTGDAAFDKLFVVKSNNTSKIKSLLNNPQLRKLIIEQKKINLEISNQKGIWEEELPEGEFELSFFADGEVNDVGKLKALYHIFMIIIDFLDAEALAHPE